MSEVEWRFPGNSFAQKNGLDTSDMETFKHDPMSSLARELIQNSIDARLSSDIPVRVEFKMFTIPRESIPGIDRITQEVVNCKEYYQRVNTNKTILKQLQGMENQIRQQEIKCLRISDFNTKGLTGVQEFDRVEKGFYILTHGSGITTKGGTSAGSKGIGKFASFVVSHFHTVFYSTANVDGEVGHQGIIKLCSSPMMEENRENEFTQGIGYYGSNHKNYPVMSQLSLDPKFTRENNTFGTDVFILGFRDEVNWRDDVLLKILDSFMATIVYGQLEVSLDDVSLTKDKVANFIFNGMENPSRQRKAVISQFLVLTDKRSNEKVIPIEDYGNIKVLVRKFDDYPDCATSDCTFIRYPYMKIKSVGFTLPGIPYAAIAIINNDKLNEKLREYENPQHTDWYTKSADPSVRREIEHTLKFMREQIYDFIKEVLSNGSSETTDVIGANEYLPYIEEGSVVQNKRTITKRSFMPATFKDANKLKTPYTVDTPDNESLLEEHGRDSSGDDVAKPDGINHGNGSDLHPSNERAGSEPGEFALLKYEKVSDMSFHFIATGRNTGVYMIVFTSVGDERNPILKLSLVDEAGQKYPVNILEVSSQSCKAWVRDQKIYMDEIRKGHRYVIKISTDQYELFAAEVSLYASR